uniref:Uncharacterized protein n=1 Tax=Chelydra serpentina TaxID=8475 RepID=A0A8C3XLW4_CHESE
MATAPSGPRRIRTNPFSASSSSFCSKAEGRASAGGCCCCCGGGLAWPLDSLSHLPHPARHLSHGPPAPSHLASPRPPFPAGLTRSVSASRRVWLSCFSSSAILAIDSFSASWSFRHNWSGTWLWGRGSQRTPVLAQDFQAAWPIAQAGMSHVVCADEAH